MSKLVLVLFVVVLLLALGVGIFYLYQTQNIPFLTPPSVDEVVQTISKDCKDTGISEQEQAISYLDSLFVKANYTNERQIKEGFLTSVIPVSGNCWAIWIGEPNQSKKGTLYWEDSKGNLKNKKTIIGL
jgi:cytoskeletal protein RodZ